MAMTINGTSGVTYPDNTLATTAYSTRFRNRIINGDMRIDQRNNGASVTPASGTYTVDRWAVEMSQASKFSFQQNAGAVTPPNGFTNYLGITSTAATTVGAGDYFLLSQKLEGLNIADLGWGTANAKTITLSFWVRSSLTGTFAGDFQNSANNRFYPFSYTISAANTWEQKSITVAGDTSGTWLATNGVGINLRLSLGTGSTYLGAAGSWGSTAYLGVTGQTNLVATSGATFYITGVQLEAGSVANSFEYVDYGTQLLMCQRYYENTWYPNTTSANINATTVGIIWATNYSSGFKYLVVKRASPTVIMYSRSGTAGALSSTASGADITTATASNIGISGFWAVNFTNAQTTYSYGAETAWASSAEL
jgi:hypothetical protein